MSNDDYLPEDHEAAKAVFAEKGPLGLVASRGFSSQNSCSASRSGGYLAYLPQVRHRRRSEEHTSELQSLMRISYAVFCLKKNTTYTNSSKTSYTKHLSSISNI